jgi:hypothetical protein
MNFGADLATIGAGAGGLPALPYWEALMTSLVAPVVNRLGRRLLVLLALASLPWLGGCAPEPVSPVLHATEARSRKLMALAAEEAGRIPDPDMRLTRQLNLADVQIGRDWKDDARKSLAAARATLAAPESTKLGEQARLGGWVSVSELSRRSHDTDVAAAATDAALAELNKIEDPAARCEYVMGVANELQYSKGKPAAAALLDRAGPWTRSIDSVGSRRQALVAFATALFNLDDFDAGRKMLDQESDPAWRSDVLAGMAENPPTEVALGTGVVAPVMLRRERVNAEAMAESGLTVTATGSASGSAGGPDAARSVSPNGQPFFGKQLDFEQVFKNRKSSLTTQE